MTHTNITIIVPDNLVLIGAPDQPRQIAKIDNLASFVPPSIHAVQINALGAVEVEYADGRPGNTDIGQEVFEAVIEMAVNIMNQKTETTKEATNG